MKFISLLVLVTAFALPAISHAQLSGHNTKGDFGLQSGTQAPPGFYIVPLYYDYSADTLRDGNGDRFDPLGGGGYSAMRSPMHRHSGATALWTSACACMTSTARTVNKALRRRLLRGPN